MAVNQAHRTFWGRIILSLFILAWGSASAQPCLMVMDLPAEPPAAGAHATHGEHASSHDEMPECEHCPSTAMSAAALCAQGLNADCGAVPESNSDGRSNNPVFKSDAQPAMPNGIRHENYKPQFRPATYFGDQRQLKRRTGPSLSIKHCLFLK